MLVLINELGNFIPSAACYLRLVELGMPVVDMSDVPLKGVRAALASNNCPKPCLLKYRGDNAFGGYGHLNSSEFRTDSRLHQVFKEIGQEVAYSKPIFGTQYEHNLVLIEIPDDVKFTVKCSTREYIEEIHRVWPPDMRDDD